MASTDQREFGNILHGEIPELRPSASPEPEDNTALLATLTDYCTSSPAPDYALMLNGPWGSGKSFLISHFIKETLVHHLDSGNSRHPLVVSLYGVASAEDFSEALYVALHPMLSSNGARLLGAVAKGLLKSTVKIDLTETQGRKSSASLGLGIPDLDKLKLTGSRREKDRIIFFDDFERAQMSGAELLGLINPLVSNGENRVVLISNEDEINKTDDAAQKQYRRAKEKTIGFTLKIKPDLDQAYKSFTDETSDGEYKAFLKFSGPSVKEVMRAAEKPNLRVLRIAIRSFSKVFTCITPELRKFQHFEPLRDMLLVILVAFIQTQTENDDITTFKRFGHLNRSEAPSDLQEVRMGLIQAHFSTLPFSVPCLSYNILEALVCRSFVNPVMINQTLPLDARFRSADDMPSWLALWNYTYCSDAVLERSLARFRSDFDQRAFQNFDEMLHTFGIYLKLCRLKEDNFVDAMPSQTIKTYIEDVYQQKTLTNEDIRVFSYPDMRSSYVLGYTDEGTAGFQSIRIYLTERHTRFVDENLHSEAEIFLTADGLDANLFLRSVSNFQGNEGRFAEVPILKNIPPDDFVHRVFNTPLGTQDDIFRALHLRYRQHKLSSLPLSEEKSWIDQVLRKLGARAQELRPLRREAFVYAIESLGKAVSKNS
ncbi:P-loop NTPase fold protein [Gluconobacter japonicus]|uniref:P-loop NTPase fold protein n=1 Tax=Gluconobacter japonicus TaxID=376620 RepID=UPI0024ACE555|nr:P-loop NTPase fold protein [Gluconobacter japonicus]MDI6653162.1 P-loop NTPase fold protein [Gluconobacter japonicus]